MIVDAFTKYLGTQTIMWITCVACRLRLLLDQMKKSMQKFGFMEKGNHDLAAFVGLLQQLVEGASPRDLASRVPAEFRPAWNVIVNSISH